MPRRYDHIDLRAPDLALVTPFYEALLPALGFTRRAEVEGWLQYEEDTPPGVEPGAFFGVTESPGHTANENRIAFWAESPEAVARLAETARAAGARNVDGPMEYDTGYWAVFFDDPCGNRLEICYRVSV